MGHTKRICWRHYLIPFAQMHTGHKLHVRRTFTSLFCLFFPHTWIVRTKSNLTISNKTAMSFTSICSMEFHLWEFWFPVRICSVCNVIRFKFEFLVESCLRFIHESSYNTFYNYYFDRKSNFAHLFAIFLSILIRFFFRLFFPEIFQFFFYLLNNSEFFLEFCVKLSFTI